MAFHISPVQNENELSQRYPAPENSRDRIIPDWEWVVPPQPLAENYADYFQCYNDTPISVQPAEDGGVYIVYRVKTQTGESSIYCTYINSNGEVVMTENLEYVGYYPDAHVDQATGNLFTSWHGPISGSDESGDFLLYDIYHLTGEPGTWKDDPILVIDPAHAAAIFPHPNDIFIWPQVKTGPSPETDMQRVYLIATNNNPPDDNEFTARNVLICYADFDAENLENQDDLEWEYTSIPLLDEYHNEYSFPASLFDSWTVIDNQLIIAGYLSLESEPDKLICLINENYGEGEWQHYSQEFFLDEDNPVYYLPGNPQPQYLFGEGTIPKWQIMHTTHFNLIPSHESQQVSYAGAMGINFYFGDNNYMYDPLMFMIYPKTFNFDLNTHQFSFNNVFPAALQPWDLDGDGEIDEFDDDGYPLWVMDWPIFHYDPDTAIHNNQYYLTSNPDSGVMAYVWVDGQKAAAAQAEIPGYEGWENTPELAICLSFDDTGQFWYDPIFINANPASENYSPELDGMIPCFVYPGDKFEYDGNIGNIIHLFFLDDNSYGSYHSQSQGENNGSTFMYAAIRIDEPIPSNDPDEIAPNLISSINYPNPFNPSTTIEFELQKAGNIKINIYNIKGQKIRTLTNDFFSTGKHQLTWNPINQPSGIYFYQITTDHSAVTQKMILMK